MIKIRGKREKKQKKLKFIFAKKPQKKGEKILAPPGESFVHIGVRARERPENKRPKSK